MPLIVLNEYYLFVDSTEIYQSYSDWAPFWLAMKRSSRYILSIPSLATNIPQSLGNLKLPLFFCVIGKPVPTSANLFEEQRLLIESVIDDFVRVREPIVCEPEVGWHSRGSASVIVLDRETGKYSLLTAGHVAVGGVGKEVYKFRMVFNIFPSRVHIGRVRHQVYKDGWDAAVISLNEAIQPNGILSGSGVTKFEYPEPLVVHGAITGFVEDTIVQGILTDLSGWKNVWMIAPSGVLKAGDSGAPVFTRANRHLLGMYVGQSRNIIFGTSYNHFVQDAYTLQHEILDKWKVSLFI
jgi:hypothetical protein